jgi:hypothetical protein
MKNQPIRWHVPLTLDEMKRIKDIVILSNSNNSELIIKSKIDRDILERLDDLIEFAEFNDG